MLRSSAAALACVLAFAAPKAVRADEIHDRSVFKVIATGCPSGKPRSGTAFLVANWPDDGEVSLVTALHVVHGCTSIEIQSSPCDTPKNESLEAINKSSGVQVRMWPNRDLIVFRHIKGAWLTDRPRFEWTPFAGPKITGRDVVAVGATGRSVCYPDPGKLKSGLRIGQVISDGLGSVDPNTSVFIYELGAAGASGGPVTDGSSNKVIAVHEAGFETKDNETAAIVVVADDHAGVPIDRAFPDWSNVKFTPPPRPHSIAEEDDDDAPARAKIHSHFNLIGAFEVGGPIPISMAGRARIEGSFGWEGQRVDSASTNAYGLRVTPGVLLALFDEPRRDPAGVQFDESRRAHVGFSGGLGAYWRARKYSLVQLELGGLLRNDVIIEGPEGASSKVTLVPGAVVEPRLIVMWQSVALTLGLRGGVEWAPLFAYQYSLFPVTLTREGYALRPVFGASIGCDWGLK